MNAFVFAVVAAVMVAGVFAEPPSSGYGVPAPAPSTQGEYGAPEHQPQTFRHVYVHQAPDEPEDRQSRTIRVPGGDKHVNIIFVKTPSSSSHQQTEVILPEQDEHKNLVYVLLKKGENTADVKIRKSPARQPQKPDVYFIRYKDQPQQGYNAPAPAAPAPQPSQQYGF